MFICVLVCIVCNHFVRVAIYYIIYAVKSSKSSLVWSNKYTLFNYFFKIVNCIIVKLFLATFRFNCCGNIFFFFLFGFGCTQDQCDQILLLLKYRSMLNMYSKIETIQIKIRLNSAMSTSTKYKYNRRRMQAIRLRINFCARWCVQTPYVPVKNSNRTRPSVYT